MFEKEYIGCNDIHGVEIKEGDKIKVYFSPKNIGQFTVKEKEGSLIGIVKYNKHQCVFQIEFEDNKNNIISSGFGWGEEKMEVIKEKINDNNK